VGMRRSRSRFSTARIIPDKLNARVLNRARQQGSLL